MKTEELLNELDKRLTTHEAICAERWAETLSKIKRLETILIGCFGVNLLLQSLKNLSLKASQNLNLKMRLKLLNLHL